ncbi:hypothetical protein OHV05_19620 [Kitasatospora sp. NBC_00070]|uniref:hypothetical protein n=1 Tax=Kitasatospora sp. NBC_00070 TaxID=2975962 RepID=UPI0032567C20
MADGEWWRVDGPWRVLGRRSGEASAEVAESVYAPEVPAERAPEVPSEGAWLITRAVPSRPLTAEDFPGWDSITFDFPVPEPEPAVGLLPEQRAEEQAAEPPAGEEPARSFLTGRRPSPLVLLAVVVLLAGAGTGQLLALLAGWALAYVSRLGDLTRKFAVLVVPLGTLTATAVWQWGRAQGRWGAPAGPADQLGRQVWDGAPGALRLAAVLSALFLLVVTLRRRKAVAEE